MRDIDLVAPIKSSFANKTKIKNRSRVKLQKKISVRDKLFKKFKKSKLHIGKEIYKILDMKCKN